MGAELQLDDADRYSRLRLIRWWDQDRLCAAKIIVVGAGAIGNEVLKNLALLGIGQIWIVDFDTIEDSNLTRSVLFREADRGQSKARVAARALRDINPDVHARAIHGNVLTDVGLGLFSDADLVVGCLDNREARLWVNRACWKTNTPWIDGGIEEINGVVKVFIPPDSPCYECGMTENDYRLINLRYSCPQLRREEITAGKIPTTPTIASFIGGLQVQEALKLLHDLPVDSGHALVWNGLANNFYKTAYQRKDDCLSHETYPAPIELPLSTDESTAQDLFTAVRETLARSGSVEVAQIVATTRAKAEKPLPDGESVTISPMNGAVEANFYVACEPAINRGPNGGKPRERGSEVILGATTKRVSEGKRSGEGLPSLTLHLDRDLIISFDCSCGHSWPVMKPNQLVSEIEASCPRCNEFARPNMTHAITSDSPLAKEALSSLGIPPYDIVRVTDGQQELAFLLTGDRPSQQPEADLPSENREASLIGDSPGPSLVPAKS